MALEGFVIRRLACHVALLLSFFCISESVQSEQVVPLCVGDSPPYMGKSLAGDGPLVEVVRQAFQRLNVDVSSVYAPWPRLLRIGLSGDCLIVGIWRNSDRDKLFNYSSLPLLKQKLSLYKKWNRDIDENNKNLVVGIQRGTYISPMVEQQEWTLSKNTTQKQNLRLLKAGRIDLVFGEVGALDYLIAESTDLKGEFEPFPFTFEIKGAYLAMSRSSSHFIVLMRRFNEEFANMLADGSYQQILSDAEIQPFLQY